VRRPALLRGACLTGGPLHLVLAATGMLHDEFVTPERTWRALSRDALQRSFAVNAIGPALIGKHTLGHLAKGVKSAFVALSARIGSISDNRLGGWHAYRASKAALSMLICNFAVELAVGNRSAICVGRHPGTVDSALSRPFLAGVQPERVFTPELSAARLLRVLDGLTPSQSGSCLPGTEPISPADAAAGSRARREIRRVYHTSRCQQESHQGNDP
jgi:NAD(P)-dependent dehydrogenase (short-subunit alcohol dehydrogenase family)